MAANQLHRLRRSARLDKENGWIAGVCAGVCAGFAKAFGTDPASVRAGMVVTALFPPKLTIAAYLIAWAVLDD